LADSPTFVTFCYQNHSYAETQAGIMTESKGKNDESDGKICSENHVMFILPSHTVTARARRSKIKKKMVFRFDTFGGTCVCIKW
jgi:hypothetical protein